MTTTQKIISMRFITFGLIISSIGLGASCKKNTSWIMHGDFYFVNETDHFVTYATSGLEKFDIAPKSTILIKETQEGREDVKPSYFHSPLLNQGVKNSFVVKFDNNKCLETFSSKHSPLDIANFTDEKVDGRTYKFTYTFTQTDYDEALNCP